jgi:hypothetical protein
MKYQIKDEIDSVFVFRLVIYCSIFLVVSAVGAAIYQFAADPEKKNKIYYGESGI